MVNEIIGFLRSKKKSMITLSHCIVKKQGAENSKKELDELEEKVKASKINAEKLEFELAKAELGLI